MHTCGGHKETHGCQGARLSRPEASEELVPSTQGVGPPLFCLSQCQTSEVAFWQQNSQSPSWWLDVKGPPTNPRWLLRTSALCPLTPRTCMGGTKGGLPFGVCWLFFIPFSTEMQVNQPDAVSMTTFSPPAADAGKRSFQLNLPGSLPTA